MNNRAKKPPPPLKFGSPEKTNWTIVLLTVLFLIVAVGGIAAMIATDPREKQLVCSSEVRPGLTNFGTCREE